MPSDAGAYVLVFINEQPSRVYPLTRTSTVVGRASDADICIPDGSISARHARIINGPHGYEIQDLESTNGTFVGSQRVTRAPLRNADRVTVGSIDLIFLLERPISATMRLVPPGRRLLPAPTLVARPTLPLPVERTPREPARRDEDDGPNLGEIVLKLAGLYRIVRKRGFAVAVCAMAGVGLALASLFLLPPRPGATCDVKLVDQVKSNPIERDDQGLRLFRGADRAFSQEDLVRTTVRRFTKKDLTDTQLTAVAGRLRLEPIAEQLFRATYEEPMFGVHFPPLEFLTAHLHGYVQGEITRSLREFDEKVKFLRGQVLAVEKDLSDINERRARFREENADRLPEEALQTHTSRFQLEARRAELQAQVRKLEADLETEKTQVSAERPLAETRFQASQSYRDALAATNRKLSEAYARGLAAGHPEVQQLTDERQRIEGLIAQEMAAQPKEADRQTNPDYQAAQGRVDALEGALTAARHNLADTESSLGQIRHLVGDLPRVEQRLDELDHAQDETKRLHAQLFEKLKQAEIQLNLERVSAESRYEIGRPRPLRLGRVLTLALRCAAGLMLGLLVAAALIVIPEIRTRFSRALAAVEREAGEPNA